VRGSSGPDVRRLTLVPSNKGAVLVRKFLVDADVRPVPFVEIGIVWEEKVVVVCQRVGTAEIRRRVIKVLNLLRYGIDPVRGDDVARERLVGKRINDRLGKLREISLPHL